MLKKILAITLMMSLALVPAFAQTAPKEAATLEDADYRAQVAQDAWALLNILGRLDMPFSGEPDAALCWDALSAYAEDSAVEGQVFSETEMASLYADLFAQGNFADYAAEPMGQFEAAQGGYRFIAFDGVPVYAQAINSADTYDDEAVYADVSYWYSVQGSASDAFTGSALVKLVPDETSAFGARAAGYEKLSAPVFTGAEATVTLRDMDGNNYKAENVLDGDKKTCWAYPCSEAENPSVTLVADTLQTVRGLVLTPGYAKSRYAFTTNRRAQTVRVTPEGAQPIEFQLEDLPADDFEGTVVLSFGQALETSRITLEVLQSYEGSKFDDMCLSEIQPF